MQIEKHGEVAILVYFGLLLLVVVTSISSKIDVINLVYLVVVLSCSLKFILIVNNNKK